MIKTNKELRICRNCQEEKPLDLFEVDARAKGGRTNRCRVCKFESNNKSLKAFRRLYERQTKYPVPIETDEQEFTALFDIMGRACTYCGSKYESTPTIEHITPLDMENSRHHISNLTLICKSCNSAKRDKPLLVYYEQNFFDFPVGNLSNVVRHIAYFSERTFDEVVEELEEQKREYCEARGWDYYATFFIGRRDVPKRSRTGRRHDVSLA
ncbi:HNH endonuclease signature motif containing protein [Sporosarcina sp. OR05]|uniref:HNH endonuclease signature motif containing protein n=1 Tax=Sporosarcina sp. OR05 TaxID=2969819 RepID=UPI00352B4CBF